MKKECIEKALMGNRGKQNSKELWNSRAESFRQMSLKNQITKDSLIGKVQRTIGLLDKETCVLDVGCGAGRFAQYFSQNSLSYLGVDISENMIKYAKEDYKHLPNADFKVLDWNSQSLEEKFDLVFASMSGALHSIDSIKKFISHSKDYCVVERFIRDRNSLEYMAEEISGEKIMRKPHNSPQYITALIALIMDLGYTFEVVSFSDKRENIVAIENLEQNYPYIFDTLDKEDTKNLLSQIEKKSQDGNIKIEDTYDRVSIIWRV